MASARYATYGSVAYDYEKSVGAYAEVPAIDIPEYAPEVKRQQRAKARPAARSISIGNVAAAIGVFTAIVLIVLNLLGYAMLAEISETTTDAENQIIQLREERAKLLVKYEQEFNLNEIEQYAINVMGMTRPSAGQTVDVGSIKNDKAVVYTYEAEDDGGIVSDITNFISSLFAYFK